MDDYIRFGLCHEILKPRDGKDGLVKILKKAGIEAKEDMEYDLLCQKLDAYQCRIIDKCQKDREYRVKCGAKEECIDIIDLYKRIKDPSERKKYSELTIKQITKAYHDYIKWSSGKNTPCYIKSGFGDWCTSDQRCKFHRRAGLFFMFDYSRQDKECYVPQEYILTLNPKELETDVLKVIILDLYRDSMLKELVRESDTLLGKYLQYDTLLRMYTRMENNLDSMDSKELEQIIIDYQTTHKQKESIFTLDNMEHFLKSLCSLQIESKTILSIAKKISPNTIMSEYSARVVALMVNVSLFYTEWFAIGWTSWLILFPAGRKYLLEMMSDPVAAASFLLSVSITSQSVGPMIDSVWNALEKYNIKVPSEIANNILVSGISVPMRKIKSTTFGKSIEYNIAKNETNIKYLVQTIKNSLSNF